LSLSNNALTDYCATHLGDILRASSLGVLNLDGNELGDEGVGVLVETMLKASPHMSCLWCLDLSNNCITPLGAARLDEAMAEHPGLKGMQVSLRGNR
jgi:Ran GTPase-activating protein (RanGAP) involved in mRNA processing and transport